MTRAELRYIANMVVDEIRACGLYGKWLTFKQAQEYAEVSPNTLRKWINQGYIYATKPTGDWRIDRESIDDFFNMERA